MSSSTFQSLLESFLRGRICRSARRASVAAFVIGTAAFCCTAVFFPACVSAQESDVSLETLLQRIERLEEDNQRLRSKVEGDNTAEAVETSARPVIPPSSGVPRGWIYSGMDTGEVFVNGEAEPLLTEAQIRNIISEEMAERQDKGLAMAGDATTTDSVAPDVMQDKRIAALDKAFKDLQDKASKKTYPTVAVSGVFQADAGWIHQDSNSFNQYGQIKDGSDFRRARLGAKGSVTETTNYFFQMDFGFFGRPTFTDVWVEQTKVPFFGNVRIGQWKQPFSLEVVSSFRYTTFMERSTLFQAFTPFRHIGIGFYNNADDLSATWAASVFRTGQDQFGGTLSSDGGYGTAERFTWCPTWENGGKNYLHLGIGHFFNKPPDDTVNFRTIPEFFVGANGPGVVGTSGQAVPGGANGTPFFVSTGNLNVPMYNVLGTELLWVQGPLSVQSEAMVNIVNQTVGGTATLPGTYAQVGYFLTGEHRPYDRKTATIDRVIPKSNLSFNGKCCDSGLGAWEVAGRWSYLDLNDRNIQGGTIMDYTAGLNWYWNPNTKMVFNYIHSISTSATLPNSQTDLLGMRAQLDF